MRVVIEGCRAGRNMNIKVIASSDAIPSIQINGYVETPSLSFHYLRSPFRIVKNGFLSVRLPSILLPSYECGPFKIWYECVVITKGREGESQFRKRIAIYNNNLLDYSNEVLITLSMEQPDYSRYRQVKEAITSKLLENIAEKGFSPLAKVETQEILDEIGNISQAPYFEGPSVLLVDMTELCRTVFSGDTKIAMFYYPEILRFNSLLRIQYLVNVQTTAVSVARNLYEKDDLQDVQIIFHRIFSTNGCVERVFPLQIDGFPLKTFLFEVKYVLTIVLDGVEITLQVPVASRNNIIRENGF